MSNNTNRSNLTQISYADTQTKIATAMGTSWTQISVGSSHVLGIKSDGKLFSWGNNKYGQLGNNGSSATTSSPVQIGTSVWKQIAAGGDFSLAVRGDNLLFAWGDNSLGQLGISSSVGSGWASVYKGTYFTVALRNDGSLWGWGYNNAGQLNTGNTINQPTPVRMFSPGVSWKSVTAGSYHVLALRGDNTIWTWGANDYGQLGDNTIINKSSPIQIGTSSNWSIVAASGGKDNQYTGSSFAVNNLGQLYAWGRNDYGQLGTGDTVYRSSPVQINTIGASITQISAGPYNTFLLTTDGTILGNGANSNGNIGDGTTVDKLNFTGVVFEDFWSSVTASDNHTMAITTTGLLYAWGYNGYGQLGVMETQNHSSPVQISSNNSWLSISAGNNSSMAVRADNTLWVWGNDNYGKLGDGAVVHKSSPVQISGTWSSGSMGYYNTTLIRQDGSIYSVGYNVNNDYGSPAYDLNIYRSSPVQVGTVNYQISPTQIGSSSWITVSAGINHAVAIRSDSTLWSWGDNTYGKLGNGSGMAALSSPVQVGTSKYGSISAGADFTVAIDGSGRLMTWGNNLNGQLGVSDTTAPSSWLMITSSKGGSSSHVLAIRNDGMLFAWGRNDYGQLGTGDTFNRSSPVQISSYSWTTVSTNINTSAAIRKDGSLFVWGDNTVGEIGDGTVSYRSSPIQIGTSSWIAVASGSLYSATLGIKLDGSLWSWGYNAQGQLGDNTIVNKSSPVQVTGGALPAIAATYSWTTVETGGHNAAVGMASFAIRSDGLLFGWGNNSNQILGDNTSTNRSSPVQIGASSFTSVMSGSNYSMFAIDVNNRLFGWGLNTSGQLGDSTVTSRATPVLLGYSFKQVAATGVSTSATMVAVKQDGSLWGWGIKSLAYATDYATTSYSMSWSQLTTGGSHALAIRSDGRLLGWGNNAQGQLADSTVTSRALPTQTSVTSGAGDFWKAIAAGASHTVGIRQDGSLWTWGYSSNRQLGVENTNASTPVTLSWMPGSWTNVAAGGNTTAGIKTDSTMYIWGDNTFKQALVPNLSWTKLATSGNSLASHVLAIRSDGMLFGMGLSANGQLAHYSNANTTQLLQIGNSSWATASVGNNFSLAIKTDGTLWSWGDNTQGQLGDATTISRSSPVQVLAGPTLSNSNAYSVFFYGAQALATPASTITNIIGTNGLTTASVFTIECWVFQQFRPTTANVGPVIGDNNPYANTSYWSFGPGSTGALVFNWTGGTTLGTTIIPLNTWTHIALVVNSTIRMYVNGSLESMTGTLAVSNATGTTGFINIGGYNGGGVTTPFNNNTTPNTIPTGFYGLISNLRIVKNTALYTGKFTPSTSPLTAIANTTLLVAQTTNIYSDASSNSYTLIGATADYKKPPTAYTCLTPFPAYQSYTQVSWTSVTAGSSYSMAIASNGTLWGWGFNNVGQAGNDNPAGYTYLGYSTRSSPVQVGTDSWTMISAGASHTIGIKADGTLWGWGTNSNNQLGTPDPIYETVWNSPKAYAGMPAVAGANGYQAGIIRNDGTLWTWGYNEYGGIGNNSASTTASPVQIPGSWSQINTGGGAGFGSMYGLKADGSLWSWGYNTSPYVSLGLNDYVLRSSPVQIGTSSWTQLYTTGYQSGVAKKLDGTIWGWGAQTTGKFGQGDVAFKNTPVQLKPGAYIDAFTSAYNTATIFLLDNSNVLYGAGSLVGDNTAVNYSSFVQVATGVSKVSMSLDATLMLKLDGTLWGWGSNTYGGLGLGDTVARSSPVQLTTRRQTGIVDMHGSHVLYNDGTIEVAGTYSGYGGAGMYGPNSSYPVTISRDWFDGESAVAFVGIRAITTNTGKLYTWANLEPDLTFNAYPLINRFGGNIAANGKVGNPVFSGKPLQITSGSWTSVAAGNSSSAAIRSDGLLYAWGKNDYGQLGNPTSWIGVRSFSSTYYLRDDGVVFAQGYNQWGQLGLGDTVDRSSPVQISTTSGSFTQISAAWSRLYMLRNDGILFGTGSGGFGTLGYSVTSGNSTSSPVQVNSKKWRTIAGGILHTLGIAYDGTLWSWGYNAQGQLGDNLQTLPTPWRSSPVQIGTDTDWKYVASGWYGWSSYAIKNNNTLWVWGANGGGQLGDGTTIDKFSPVQIPGSWSQISTEGAYNVDTSPTSAVAFVAGLRTDGTLWMWGNNSTGALGQFIPGVGVDTSNYSSPVQVGTGLSGVVTYPTTWKAAYILPNDSYLNTYTNGAGVFGIDTNNNLWFWGGASGGSSNSNTFAFNLLGGSQVYPTQITFDSSWDTLDGKNLQNYSLIGAWFKKTGELYMWGDNSTGRIGDGTTVFKTTPTLITTLQNGDVPSPRQVGTYSWTTITAGFNAMSAVRSDNTLWSWGYNSVGQLGDGTTINRSSPVQIMSGGSWTKVFSGSSFTVGISSNGILNAWGAAAQLGSGAIGNASSPVQVGTSLTLASYYQLSALPNKVPGSWSQVAVGWSHVAAIKTDGTLWAWGDNSVGQLGQPAAYMFFPPIATGTALYAIKPNGELWGWGDNTQGQLAQGDTVARSSPTQIGSDSWKQIATGLSHTVAIKSNDTLWAWGLNNAGQLGLNDTVTRSSPVQVGTSSWSQIAAGGSHTIAIAPDATVYAWGFNANGQLGDNTTVNKSSPIQVSTSSWTQISARSNNTAGIKAYSLYTWGDNTQWQLGDATTISRSSPVQVFGTSQWSWRLISVGATHMVAIKTPDDTLYTWGYNNVGQLGLGDVAIRSSATQVGGDARWNFASAGADHTLAVRKDYVAFGWGLNSSGQIGDNTAVNKSVPTLVLAAALANNVSIYQVSAGISNSLALSTAGTYYVWGYNGTTQLLGRGDGTTTNKSSPVLVGAAFLANVISSPVQIGTSSWTSVAVGDRHTAATKADKTLWTWGYNLQGQLGATTTHTVSVLSVGALYSSLIRSDGVLFVWGYNNYGQGLGAITNMSSPVQLGYYSWNQISTGNSHTLAIRSDGRLFAWGLNTSGQLGDNTLINRSGPVQITMFNDWTSVSAGNTNSLAIRNSGKLYAWGYNAYGQNGTLSWAKVASGYSHTLAIRSDGALFAWGLNTSGQLGNNAVATLSSPSAIGTSSWNAVATGYDISIAIKGDGTLWAWGNNINGAIGDGTTVSKSSPVLVTGGLVAGLTVPGSWVQVSAGRSFLTAQRTDGTVYTWGLNANGQLGQGDTVSRSSPTQLGTGSWTTVAAGGNHVLALQANQLYAWGDNTFGQLGDNTSISKSSPIQVGTTSWAQIVASVSSSFAIDTSSKLWAWGNNNNGQLGNSNRIHQSSPVQIGDSSWITVSSKTETTYGIKSDYTLWGWGNGYNQNAQLPMVQSLTTPYSWTMIGGGGQTTTTNHYLGIRNDGALFAWGYNNNGQLGLGDTLYRSSPVQVGTSSWSMVTSTYEYFSHAITSDGRLFTWGNNNSGNDGMLGDGTTIDKSSPVQVAGSWVTVGPGIGISYVSGVLGSLYTWGVNTYGQLGDSTTVNKSIPVKLGTSSWTQVSATKFTKMAIRTGGGLFTWGNNSNGQLGANTATTIHRSSPVQVGALTTWTTLYMGGNGLNAAGLAGTTLYIWGDNTQGQLGDNTTVSKSSPVTIAGTWSYLRLGNYTTAAINSVGALFTWGSSVNGQLGDGSTTSRSSPVQLGFPTSYNYVGATDAGTMFARRITDNMMFGWGALGNIAPAIGVALSDTTTYSSPVQIPAGVTSSAVQIMSSASSPVQISTTTVSDQSAYSLKLNGTTQYVQYSIINSVSLVDFTMEAWVYTTSLASNREIFMTGTNGAGPYWEMYLTTTGALAFSNATGVVIAQSTNTIALNTWTHCAVVNKSNTLRVYLGGQGGTSVSYTTPVNTGTGWNAQISGPSPLANATYFAGYISNMRFTKTAIYDTAQSTLTVPTSPLLITPILTDTLLLAANGKQVVDQSVGGVGGTINYGVTLADAFSPFTSSVAQISWTQVSAGGLHTVATAYNVEWNLHAWGYNGQGQLGAVDLVTRSSPTQVGVGTLHLINSSQPMQVGIDNWSQAYASGGYQTIGFKSNNTLWTWGYNGVGQLGRGDAVNRSSPVQLGGSWSQVATYGGVSISHIAAIKTDGTLYVWGQNNYGQIGDGTTINKSSPTQIGNSSWTMVAIGNLHTLAGRADGTYWGWGYNNYGQVGDLTLVNRSSPVQVAGIGVSSLVKIAAGEGFNIALTNDNRLWGWGRNTEGELATYDAVNKGSPILIGGSSTLIPAQTVRTYFAPSLLLNYRKPFAYDIFSSSPVQVGTSSWVSISAGSDTTAGVTLNGSLFTWGKNDLGQLGDGGMVAKPYPVQVLQQNGLSDPNAYGTTFGASTFLSVPIGTSSAFNFAVNQDFTIELWVYITTASRTIVNWGTYKSAYAVESVLLWTDTSAVLTTSVSAYTINYPVASVPLNMWNHIALVRYNNSTTLYLNGNPGTPVSTPGAATPVVSRPDLASPFGLHFGINSTNWTAYSPTYFAGTITNVRYVLGTAVYTGGFTSALPTNTLTVTQTAASATVNAITSGTVFLGLQNATLTDNASGLAILVTGTTTVNIATPFTSGYSYASFTQVSAGTSYIQARRADSGYIAGFGLGTTGQLGDNTNVTKSSPTLVLTGAVTYLSWPTQLTATTTSSWTSVGGYLSHVAAITSTGLLYTWGSDSTSTAPYGVFGIPGTPKSPILVSTSIPVNVGGTSLPYSASPVQVGTSSWIQASAGQRHVLAIDSSNRLFGWGSYAGTYTGPGAGYSWKQLSLSERHTLAIRGDGKLFGWGQNVYGQLGDSSTVYRSSPVQIGSSSWSSVSAGFSHTAAIDITGKLFTWGANDYGQIGDITTTHRSSPVQVGAQTYWSSASAGGYHTVALNTSGSLYTWGRGDAGQIGTGDAGMNPWSGAHYSSPVQISTNTLSNNNAYSLYFRGQTDALTFNAQAPFGFSTGDFTIEAWVYIIRSIVFTDAYIYDGRYNGTAAAVPTLAVISMVPTYKITAGNITTFTITGTAITAGAWHHIAVARVASVTTMYVDGVASGTPTADTNTYVAGTSNAPMIGTNAAGSSGINGFISNLRVVKGVGVYTGTFTVPTSPLSISQAAGTNIAAVTGSQTSLLIAQNSTYLDNSINAFSVRNYATGRSGNTDGTYQIPTISTFSPFTSYVQALSWKSAIASGQTSYAIRQDGTLWAWGYNVDGQIGDSTNTSRYLPKLVGTTADRWLSMVPTYYSILAIKLNGTLWGWGYNQYGWLGTGETSSISVPTQVGSKKWTSIAGGSVAYGAGGTTSDGQVWVWGYNAYGQLTSPLNYNADSSSPVQLASATSHAGFGNYHGAYFDADNALNIAGYGGNGQLGTGNTIARSSPVQISTGVFGVSSPVQLSAGSWKLVAAGSDTSYAFDSNNVLYFWGKNNLNQSGINNSSQYIASPVTISGTITNPVDNGVLVNPIIVSSKGNTGGAIILP